MIKVGGSIFAAGVFAFAACAILSAQGLGEIPRTELFENGMEARTALARTV